MHERAPSYVGGDVVKVAGMMMCNGIVLALCWRRNGRRNGWRDGRRDRLYLIWVCPPGRTETCACITPMHALSAAPAGQSKPQSRCLAETTPEPK